MSAILALFAAATAPPVPTTLDAVVAAFNAACVAPGADLTAERKAALASGAVLAPPQSTAPASIEMYDAGAITYVLAPGPKGDTCSALGLVAADANTTDLTALLSSRFGAVIKPPRGNRMSQSGAWTTGRRRFSYELSNQNGLRGALLNVSTERE